MNTNDNPLVYSTDIGRIKAENSEIVRPRGDGIVRIQRQVAGRKGKGVCLIMGLNLASTELNLLAAELKKRCGSGGCVKEGQIEIQGDKRDILKTLLENKGYKVKLVGG